MLDLSFLKILPSEAIIANSDSDVETVGAAVVVIELLSCLTSEKRLKTDSKAASANLPRETVLLAGISKQ